MAVQPTPVSLDQNSLRDLARSFADALKNSGAFPQHSQKEQAQAKKNAEDVDKATKSLKKSAEESEKTVRSYNSAAGAAIKQARAEAVERAQVTKQLKQQREQAQRQYTVAQEELKSLQSKRAAGILADREYNNLSRKANARLAEMSHQLEDTDDQLQTLARSSTKSGKALNTLGDYTHTTAKRIFSLSTAAALLSTAFVQASNDMRAQARAGSLAGSDGFFTEIARTYGDAWKLGIDASTVAELEQANRAAMNAMGGTVQFREELGEMSSEMYKHFGSLDASARFTSDALTMMRTAAITPTTDMLKSVSAGGMGLIDTFDRIKKITGKNFEEINALVAGFAESESVRYKLMGAQTEQQRRNIMIEVAQRHEMLTSMGYLHHQAQAAGEALDRMAGKGARERFRDAAKLQAGMSAMGMSGEDAAEAARIHRLGLRATPEDQQKLERLMSTLNNRLAEDTAGPGATVATDFLADMVTQKIGMAEVGRGTPFIGEMVKAFEPMNAAAADTKKISDTNEKMLKLMENIDRVLVGIWNNPLWKGVAGILVGVGAIASIPVVIKTTSAGIIAAIKATMLGNFRGPMGPGGPAVPGGRGALSKAGSLVARGAPLGLAAYATGTAANMAVNHLYNPTDAEGQNVKANVSSALSGAATGAAVGAFLGPIGVAAGGLIGGVAGYFLSKKDEDERLTAARRTQAEREISAADRQAQALQTARAKIEAQLRNVTTDDERSALETQLKNVDRGIATTQSAQVSITTKELQSRLGELQTNTAVIQGHRSQAQYAAEQGRRYGIKASQLNLTSTFGMDVDDLADRAYAHKAELTARGQGSSFNVDNLLAAIKGNEKLTAEQVEHVASLHDFVTAQEQATIVAAAQQQMEKERLALEKQGVAIESDMLDVLGKILAATEASPTWKLFNFSSKAS